MIKSVQICANLCKSSEILKQYDVKWWLSYRKYGSVSHSFSCYIIGIMHFKVNLTISYIFSYWWLLHFYDWVASWKPRQETMQLFSKISKEPSSKTERWVIKRLCVLEKHRVCFFHSTKREKIDEFYCTSIKK